MNDRVNTTLPFFGIIKVTGADAVSFLHNQLSNDIEKLPVNGACYACYNTPQGRVLANMLLLKTEDAVFLALAQDLCASISKRLKMYILRSKVTLEEADDFILAASLPRQIQTFTPTTELPCTQLTDTLWQIKLPYGGQYLFGRKGIPELSAENAEQIRLWAEHEIQAGTPWISAPSSEHYVAQMLNLHQSGAVHFKKGCYPGQEIIARAQYRGQVKRGLITVSSPDKLMVGDAIVNQDGEEVGGIINTVESKENQSIALAVIKFSAVQSPVFTQKTELTKRKQFFEYEQT